MCVPHSPKQVSRFSSPQTPLTAPALSGLVLCSEHGPNQKERPHLPIRTRGKLPISAPTLCLPPTQCMDEGHCSARGNPPPQGLDPHLSPAQGPGGGVPSFCITIFSLSTRSSMAGGAPAPGSLLIHNQLRPSPHLSPAPIPLPFTPECVERTVCSSCLLFLAGLSVHHG